MYVTVCVYIYVPMYNNLVMFHWFALHYFGLRSLLMTRTSIAISANRHSNFQTLDSCFQTK